MVEYLRLGRVYQGDGLGGWISDDFFEFDDVGVSSESSEDLDFPFDFGLLDWFEDLDNYIFVISYGGAHVDFGVLALPDFGDDFVAVDVPSLGSEYPYSMS